MHSRAAELIRLLDLRPHPEGGWYRETFPNYPPERRAVVPWIL